jgi:hypothetical protein
MPHAHGQNPSKTSWEFSATEIKKDRRRRKWNEAFKCLRKISISMVWGKWFTLYMNNFFQNKVAYTWFYSTNSMMFTLFYHLPSSFFFSFLKTLTDGHFFHHLLSPGNCRWMESGTAETIAHPSRHLNLVHFTVAPFPLLLPLHLRLLVSSHLFTYSVARFDGNFYVWQWLY